MAFDEHIDSCLECREVVFEAARSRRTDLALSPTTAGDGRPSLRLALEGALARGASVGRYVVLDKLGSGGMGVVYAAFDPELDRKVAVKVLRPELIGGAGASRLLREGRAIAKLAHPNVVTVFDVGGYEGSVFVAMELVAGGSLDRWAATPRSWHEVLRVFLHAGDGLAAAHAAGIVHRDFKLANVLLGDDGRARVTDFGLARMAGTNASAPTTTAHSPDVEALTISGAIVGTPAYMSPEQWSGEQVGPASDQFSFAVALYEALYGERPFAGDTVAGIVDNVTAQRIRPVPAGKTVPPWLRQVVLRALRASPVERYPSLDAMLAALRHDPAQRRRRVALAALVPGALILGAVAVAAHDAGDEVCAGARPKLERIWNAEARDQVKRAFLATGKPYAATSWQAVERSLDQYADSWVAAHVDTCRATNVRREQSTDVLDLRMQCLDRRYQELRVTLDLLARADVAVVDNATSVVGRLVDVHGCANLDTLRAPTALPTAPALQALVTNLRQQIARGFALSDAGKYREALAFAPEVASAARRLGFRPLEAEALLMLGDVQAMHGDKAAEQSLHDAIVAAEASGDELAAARGWKGLAAAVGVKAGRHAEALGDADHASAILARLDPNGLAYAQLEDTRSILLRETGHLAEARAAAERAIRVLERVLPSTDPRRTRAYTQLGNIEVKEGHLDKAQATFERVLRELQASLGPDHPMVIAALGNVANTLDKQGKYVEALAYSKRQLALEEAALGPEHPDLVAVYNQLGNLASDLARWDEAIGYYTHARMLVEKAYGPHHPDVLAVINDLALVERDRGRLAESRRMFEDLLKEEEALYGPDNIQITSVLNNIAGNDIIEGRLDDAKQRYERLLAIRRKTFGESHPDIADAYVGLANVEGGRGNHDHAIVYLQKALAIEQKVQPDHPKVAVTLYNLGNSYFGVSRWHDAEETLRRSLSLMENRNGKNHPNVAMVLLVLAATLDKLHRTAEGLPLVERALAIVEKTGSDEELIAEILDTLATMLWKVPGGDRDRAATLARRALAHYKVDTPDLVVRKQALRKWMKARGIAP